MVPKLRPREIQEEPVFVVCNMAEVQVHGTLQVWSSQDNGGLYFKNIIRKDYFQNKTKFITEDHFTKHMNITILN
jgi:hypothetical protein